MSCICSVDYGNGYFACNDNCDNKLEEAEKKKSAATTTIVNFMKEQCNYHCKQTNGIWAAWKKFVPWWIQNGVLVANKWATIFDYLVYATLIFARRFSLIFLSQPKAHINSWAKGTTVKNKYLLIWLNKQFHDVLIVNWLLAKSIIATVFIHRK